MTTLDRTIGAAAIILVFIAGFALSWSIPIRREKDIVGIICSGQNEAYVNYVTFLGFQPKIECKNGVVKIDNRTASTTSLGTHYEAIEVPGQPDPCLMPPIDTATKAAICYSGNIADDNKLLPRCVEEISLLKEKADCDKVGGEFGLTGKYDGEEVTQWDEIAIKHITSISCTSPAKEIFNYQLK